MLPNPPHLRSIRVLSGLLTVLIAGCGGGGRFDEVNDAEPDLGFRHPKACPAARGAWDSSEIVREQAAGALKQRRTADENSPQSGD